MSAFETVDISTLRVGAALSSPINDEAGMKLLGEGVEITENLLRRLRDRGISRVAIGQADLSMLQELNSTATDAADATDFREASARGARRQLVALTMLGRRSRKNVDPVSLLNESALMCADSLYADRYAIALLSSEDTLRLRVGTRAVTGRVPETECRDLPAGSNDSLAAYTIEQDEPITVAELATDERFCDEFLEDLGVVSALSAPIFYGADTIGAVSIYSSTPREFTEEESLFVEAMGGLVAVSAKQAIKAHAPQPPTETHDADQGTAENRRHQRFEYDLEQRVAPVLNGQLPSLSAFRSVRVLDISVGGISFLWRARPEQDEWIVALGQGGS
ncbi:MAG: hypothetical protein CMJ64_13925 [Planctomycetaceae bacterium]|nr:hypothetical protein [Planctomycetaceae bacterium]